MEYSKDNFLNRELSWLEFNGRVLEQAEDKTNPLLERLKFLSITSSNLDEFFMIRVAGLKAQIQSEYNQQDISGLTPKEQLQKVEKSTIELVKSQYAIYNNKLLKELKKEKIEIIDYSELTKREEEIVERYFQEIIFPIVTPMAIDSSRRFPHLSNKSFNLIIQLSKEKELFYSVLQIPTVVDRFLEVSLKNDENRFILLEEIIKKHIEVFYEGYSVNKVGEFRLTRNSDVFVDEEEADDLLFEIQKSLDLRKWGAPVRLEVKENIDKELLEFLITSFELSKESLYSIDGPIDLRFLFKFSTVQNRDELLFKNTEKSSLNKKIDEEESIFNYIAKKDVILHHPFESFDPVIRLVREASEDPKVLAIKQTLYRVGDDSPIVYYLMEAAKKGKQVTVVIEIKARFDEEQNIRWARELELAGCHVIYGLKGLKTHAKCLLIVRKEEIGIVRYVHLSTGNYNHITSNVYTDLGFMTTNEDICEDVSALFNMLTGFSEPRHWNKLIVAPRDLRKKVVKQIDNEIKIAQENKKAKIIIKSNSLVDKEIIEKLYEASEKGVKIDLIIRGACALKSGVKKISENIKVHSIVGRYLEHSRIYYFENEKNEKVFISSADMMERNLDRRVELMIPIEKDSLKKEIIEILGLYLKDNVKRKIQNSQGKYIKAPKTKDIINSQEEMIKIVKGRK